MGKSIIMMLRMLLKIIILIDLNCQILFGKRRSSSTFLMLTLLKLFKSDERSLVSASGCRRGDRTGVEFEHIRGNRVGGADYFR